VLLKRFNIKSNEYRSTTVGGKTTKVNLGLLKLNQLLKYFAHYNKLPSAKSFKEPDFLKLEELNMVIPHAWKYNNPSKPMICKNCNRSFL
jgi:hypothetical protein